MLIRAILGLAAAALLVVGLAAQGLDAVSIKPTPDPPVRTGMFPKPGLLYVGNYTLKRLIEEVYDVKPDRVAGGPGWIDKDCFDLVAKAPDAARFGEMRRRLIPVLTERFRLRLRRETRKVPVYALRTTPSLKLVPAEPRATRGMTIRSTEITSPAISMARFADALDGQLGRPVIDETGLAGEFALALRWRADTGPGSEGDAPSITTAVREQLGLQLVARKALVEVLVVESAERPSAN